MGLEIKTGGLGTLGGAGAGAGIGAMFGGPVGAMIGLGLGSMAGGFLDQQELQRQQGDALAAQQARVAAQNAAQRRNISNVRQIYGTLPDKKPNDQNVKAGAHLNRTLTNRARIGGAINNNASALRDAGGANMAAGANAALAATNASSVSRGLLGSSVEGRGKQALLATYLGGRSNLAAGVEAGRQSQWNALDSARMMQEQGIRAGGSVPASLALRGMSSTLQGAKLMIPSTIFGNMVGDAVSLVGSGLKSAEQGGQGLDFFRAGAGAKSGSAPTNVSATPSSGGK